MDFVSVQGGAPRARASVTVQTLPGARCTIRYVTPAGTTSQARGLDPKTADAAGRVAWDWLIGTATRPGTGRVTVTCDSSPRTAPITIG